jgi:CubicO group peptidase (beta-lactamase class C family)
MSFWGYLIEKISGESYAQFVQDNIFKPLGMVNSGYDSNSAIIPNRASGYTPDANGVVNAGYINMTIPLSAGALYSTTEDLLRWERGLFGGKLLSPASLKKMTTPIKSDCGFGLMSAPLTAMKKSDMEVGSKGSTLCWPIIPTRNSRSWFWRI